MAKTKYVCCECGTEAEVRPCNVDFSELVCCGKRMRRNVVKMKYSKHN